VRFAVTRPAFNAEAKIVVLPAGKENPCREGSARWKRYRDLQNSKTVGEFLANILAGTALLPAAWSPS
jgi:hypothetical protein